MHINILLTLLAVTVSVTAVLLPPPSQRELGQINKQVSLQVQPIKVDEKLQPLPKAEMVVESPQAPRVASSGGDIETIVRQAARKYGVNEDYFVKIARCESAMRPNAVNKTYFENGHPSGLFQHLSGYFPARADKYGYPGGDVFDPVVNANVTAAMFADGLQHLWECK